ncbi:cbb3-type cytochrome c oxidase subunit I [Halalkalicoccus subterraneus]|uniref:cbb3-type cytochrome c oxidase subunit I n=1 Tax=Halalkalicoccus subterraneus TaxID=2675002 RepID=UPI001B886108|nr:cbb3-type cytochrome c oxidase subunit I [Halalkalicoccus subterraneus]
MQIDEQIVLTILMGLLLVIVAGWIARLENWRSYTPLTSAGGRAVDGTSYETGEKPDGLVRWLTTVDHKDIGILYGIFATIALVIGGLSVALMRTELFSPETVLLEVTTYNALMTSHGITMLFLFGTPMINAFANYVLPLLIGADDMAFPRINAIAFWLLPVAGTLIWSPFVLMSLGIEPAQTGWTMYPPLSLNQSALGIDFMLLGLHLSGISATLGAINFIATVFTERAPDVGWERLDIFSWTMLAQSGMVLFAFPLLGSVLIMLLLDRNLGTTFFTVEGGGPILYQHLFWFFGHPEVYILVLPPMGLVSLILPRFAGRKLFGFKFVVYSTLAISVLSFGVWAHHMFTTGIDPRIRSAFMAVSLAIAVPSAVKVFNWTTTLWSGRLRLTVPMLFMLGFVSNFIIGGVTGVFLASIPINSILHATYYIVGHFHYIVMGAIGFALLGAVYYWFPLVTGRMYQRQLGLIHFWLSFIGTNVTFFAMILLGYGGMPRRYAEYLPQYATLHQVTTIGAFLIFIGGVVFLWNIVQSSFEGQVIENGDPWQLQENGLMTNEWVWLEHKIDTSLADGGEDEVTSTNNSG